MGKLVSNLLDIYNISKKLDIWLQNKQGQIPVKYGQSRIIRHPCPTLFYILSLKNVPTTITTRSKIPFEIQFTFSRFNFFTKISNTITYKSTYSIVVVICVSRKFLSPSLFRVNLTCKKPNLVWMDENSYECTPSRVLTQLP